MRRGLADLGLLAAHDPGERDRAVGVGDHEVVGDERALDAVERRQPLAGPGAADDDLRAVERREVEGVERVSEREHHVVRDVDDVRDRPLPRQEEARAQPLRRGRDRDVLEEPADVARAALEVVDPNRHVSLRAVSRGLSPDMSESGRS